jgi:hypothetical protein
VPPAPWLLTLCAMCQFEPALAARRFGTKIVAGRHRGQGCGQSNRRPRKPVGGSGWRERLAMAVAVTVVSTVPVTLGTATVHATTINCQHTGPIVGHPGISS